MEPIQITNFINPDRTMDTEYGYVSGLEWLRKEKKRVTTAEYQGYIEVCKEKGPQLDYIALFKKEK